jgi:hypothetical protein
MYLFQFVVHTFAIPNKAPPSFSLHSLEYPGHNYSFNWCLNGDGVTPTKKSAFRICKPLDLKVSGLQPAQSPLKVCLSSFRLDRLSLYLNDFPYYIGFGFHDAVCCFKK